MEGCGWPTVRVPGLCCLLPALLPLLLPMLPLLPLM